MKAGWRFATMENGEQFVTIAGMMSMHKLYAGNLGSLILVGKSYLRGMQLCIKMYTRCMSSSSL